MKETLINVVLRTPEAVEKQRAAQAEAARVTALGDGWTSDSIHPKTISVLLKGGEVIGLEAVRTTTVDELLGEIKRLKQVTDAFLLSLHDRHGGLPLGKETPVISIPGAITEGLFCSITPKPTSSNAYYFSVTLNRGEKIAMQVFGEDELTIGRVKTAIGEKLAQKGFRVSNAQTEIEIIISGKRITDNELPLNLVPGLERASSIYVVHSCPLLAPEEVPLILVTRDGALENPQATDRSSSILNLVTAGGEIIQVEARRDQTLLGLLMNILGLTSAKELPLDTLLRTITAQMSVELDLNQTLSESRIGPNAMLFLQGTHALAAARDFSDRTPVSTSFPLPRSAGGRVFALTDDTASAFARAGAGAGAGSSSTTGGGSGSAIDTMMIVGFLAEFIEKYTRKVGRVRMLFNMTFLNNLALLSSPQDQYNEVKKHMLESPTCLTANVVRDMLIKPKYASLKPDFQLQSA